MALGPALEMKMFLLRCRLAGMAPTLGLTITPLVQSCNRIRNEAGVAMCCRDRAAADAGFARRWFGAIYQQ